MSDQRVQVPHAADTAEQLIKELEKKGADDADVHLLLGMANEG